MSVQDTGAPDLGTWNKIQNLFSSPSLAAGRNILSAVFAVFATLGIISATQAQSLIDKIMAVGSAVGVLVTAISGLVMVAMPIVAGLKSTMASQRKSVSLQPHTIVVQAQTPAATVQAAAAVAAVPGVAQVVASPRVADATPSDKVVAAADAKTVTVTS